MALTYKEISEVLKIIDSSNCEEIVLELEGMRLVVRRGTSSHGMSSENFQKNPPSSNELGADLNPDHPTEQKKITGHEPLNTQTHGREIIRSPMVGTFYQAPSPEEGPFVSEGSKISIGDPLCLIEVMKLYTTIEATAPGSIHSILVEDGTLVEFDQPLFIIQPD